MKPKTVKIKLIRNKNYPGSLYNTNNLTSLSIYLHMYKVTYIHIMSERRREREKKSYSEKPYSHAIFYH